MKKLQGKKKNYKQLWFKNLSNKKSNKNDINYVNNNSNNNNNNNNNDRNKINNKMQRQIQGLYNKQQHALCDNTIQQPKAVN